MKFPYEKLKGGHNKFWGSFTPTKRGSENVLAMLKRAQKGGHKKFLGSFYADCLVMVYIGKVLGTRH